MPVEEAVEVKSYTAPSPDGRPKITKIVAVFKPQKMQEFIDAMAKIDVTGITMVNVMGCGNQKGHSEYYRGIKHDLNLLPKVKAEIVVSAVPVAKVVDTAKSVLYTGHIGDGKLFIYDIEDVVKIRTGETGFDALQ